MTVPDVKLNSGTAIPQIGLGLWKNILPSAVNSSVKAALEADYTHFDTAQIYGNEGFLAKALSKADAKREDVFITTKIWNRNQAHDRLLPSFERSLKRLKSDYVDLLLLHFPVSETRRKAWSLMEEIYKSGRAKAIGVSNYTIRHLEELLRENSVKPAVNQVELHVFLQQPELLEYCRKNDIIIEAYSPLAHGHGLDDPVLQEVAKKHDKSTAQIMLRWCVEQGFVILPKSTHADRIQENIDVFDFSLTTEDMATLRALDKNLRTCWDPSDVQ